MELNGICNIIVQINLFKRENPNKITPELSELFEKVLKNAYLTQRYLIAYGDAVRGKDFGLPPSPFRDCGNPFWHEVLKNPDKYPTLRERFELL